LFFLFFLDGHTVGEGVLADDEVVLVARVVEVLGAADEEVEVLGAADEEVEVLEMTAAADDELEEVVEVVLDREVEELVGCVEVLVGLDEVLDGLLEVLVGLVEVLVDLVVVIYTIHIREGVDSRAQDNVP
jgi:hypothetical protein